ncbi:MAG: tRNA preQ1(34) S-adenosylmethionine ribosyltransferase-isomerase QueA [Spirochaetales bacterium]|nr:tRNA preQ1(34) S-adenosylmethionine ribosyltransferase-isomerase QueA [Spirochaetales bacterium]
MKTSDFSFELPEELIAYHPAEKRGTCRLMELDKNTNSFNHTSMEKLVELIPANSLMVFNNTRVRRARIYAHSKETGGQVEMLLLKDLEKGMLWECLVSKSKKQRKGKVFLLPNDIEAEIVAEEEGGIRVIRTARPLSDEYLRTGGHIPLPPYIKREDEAGDDTRYQTVYAKETGSVAAPTAGLHFTDEILAALKSKGVETEFVTLHVGMGTFSPVRSEDIRDHKMHTETYHVSDKTADAIEKAKREGRPVIAVGTTSLRTLESAWEGTFEEGQMKRGSFETDIFIYPGYKFKVISGLFTNFHTPESTLLMLVSAFAGKDLIDRAYRAAVEEKYRFFSYGDAMLIQ